MISEETVATHIADYEEELRKAQLLVYRLQGAIAALEDLLPPKEESEDVQ